MRGLGNRHRQRHSAVANAVFNLHELPIGGVDFMAVRTKTIVKGLLAGGFGIALAVGAIAPSGAEAPASQEQRIEQQSGGQLGVPQGGRGGGVAPAARPAPQQAPPVARQPPQQRQPNVTQQYDGGGGRRGGGYGGGGYRGPGFGGGYGGGDFDEGPRYRRRPPVAYDDGPSYGGGGAFGRACATSRGVCYVRRPQPYGSGCRCDIPGFGPKRGNIEG